MRPSIFSLILITLLGCSDKSPKLGNTNVILETKLMRGGNIWSLDWSPDGKHIACGNASGLLRIYDVESQELINVLTGFKATINGIHYHPSGDKIVASGGNEDPRIIIWDLKGKTRTIIEAHNRQVRSVRWSPRGVHFASTSHDGTIRIWDSDGNFIKMFKGASGGCVGIDWFDDDLIAASCWDNTIRTYTISRTDSMIIENGNHRNKAVLSVDWHPDGQLLATGDYGNEQDSIHTIKLWSNKGALINAMTSHQKEIRSLAWNNIGNILATGGETIRLWNQEGELLKICSENTSPVWSIAWNPKGQQFASGHNDGKIRIWNKDGVLINTLEGHSSRITSTAFNKDSSKIFLGFSNGELRSFDLISLICHTEIAHNRSITNVKLSHDETKLALSSNDGTLSIWNINDINQLEKIKTFGKEIYANAIEWNDSDNLVAYLDSNNKISVWSSLGEFQQTIESDEIKTNAIHWENNIPIAIWINEVTPGSSTKPIVRINQQKGELIPLNNNRFAIKDTFHHLIIGEPRDFIRMSISSDGFSELNPIK